MYLEKWMYQFSSSSLDPLILSMNPLVGQPFSLGQYSRVDTLLEVLEDLMPQYINN